MTWTAKGGHKQLSTHNKACMYRPAPQHWSRNSSLCVLFASKGNQCLQKPTDKKRRLNVWPTHETFARILLIF